MNERPHFKEDIKNKQEQQVLGSEIILLVFSTLSGWVNYPMDGRTTSQS